ncbi:MAG: DNA-binding protein WhiA [Firmicutes bacterium]|nr:DNA-binding protein WhiA [Bacillota bacterium]
MSFSHDVKDELARVYPQRDCCRRAELAGLLMASGTLQVQSGGRMGLIVSTGHPAVSRKVFRLVKDVCSAHPEFIVCRDSRPRKTMRYIVRLAHPDAERLLDALGFPRDRLLQHRPGPAIALKAHCARSYLRGFFLGSGSVAAPSGGHHLEIVSKHEEQAADLQRKLKTLRVDANLLNRENGSVVYLKEGEQIVRLLNLMGAHTALLNYENARVMKDVKNRVNRLVNMETANISKIANAAVKQSDYISDIQATVGLDALPQSLRRLAMARIQNPEASLEELGRLMDPPISKSAVNHRMRRIAAIARALSGSRQGDTAARDGPARVLEDDGPRDSGGHQYEDRVYTGPKGKRKRNRQDTKGGRVPD